ncbi:hypothetical protein ACIQYS_12865 [Psychrobacillus sp. NPDC096426]|uniref:hypothetical protein n=1 Tax=Psychrobacillus sp. NPDC096426 TaxID=3364491 RepID=UPI0038278C4E
MFTGGFVAFAGRFVAFAVDFVSLRIILEISMPLICPLLWQRASFLVLSLFVALGWRLVVFAGEVVAYDGWFVAFAVGFVLLRIILEISMPLICPLLWQRASFFGFEFVCRVGVVVCRVRGLVCRVRWGGCRVRGGFCLVEDYFGNFNAVDLPFVCKGLAF